MKKGTKLVALLLGLALVAPACNKPAATTSQPAGDQSSEPAQSSEAPVNYKVTISNKEELQAEWFVGDQSRKVNIETDPKANIAQLVNEGKITITSSDAQKLTVTGQMASPVAAGEVTITVKCGDSTDTVKITLQAKQTVKEKFGVNHEGTEADPFDNEDACKVAKSDKYNNEDFYVKGVVSSFYYAPGSRTDGAVAFYLTPAEGQTEKFEVFKCFKDKEQKQFLTDDDIWVGGTVTAHGQFTVYNKTQAETTSAIFVKCEGNKPQPRQTLTKTFAEVLALGNALADGADSWDYIKFQGYVSSKSGNNYFLTATKGEALIPGKSDADHQEKDIVGTNAIELYNAGKVAELVAKLLEGAKVEVTMVVKNYHGTIENGFDLKNEDVTVIEEGQAWSVPEPAVANKTVTEFVALENNKKNAYNVKATIKAWKGDAPDKYGNMTITDGTTDLVIYGASATATALEWDKAESYAFTNPQDFLTNDVTKVLKIGDEITMKLIRADYTKDGVTTIQGTGIITAVTPSGTPAPVIETFTLDYSGLTSDKNSEITTDALEKLGQGNAHVTAVEASKIYCNTGSGGAFPTAVGMVKGGTGSANGSIAFTLDVDVVKVEVTCHDFYKKSADYPTNSNYVKVNDLEAQLAPYTEDGTFGDLTFELAAGSKSITIETQKRVYIKAIKFSYVASGETPAANEALPWYTEGKDNQAIHFEGAGIWTWVNYGTMGYADFNAFNAAKANIVAAYASEPAATVNEVVVSDDIAASKVCRVYIVLSAAYNTGVLTLKIPGADGKTYEGTLEFAAGVLSKINGQAAPHDHAWVDGTVAQNTDGKNVTPLSCSCGKVGAKMAMADYSSAEIDTGLKFKKNSNNTWKIIAPKAGKYEIRVSAKIDAVNVGHNLSESPVTCKVGETDVAVSTGTFSELGVGTSNVAEFVLVPEATFAQGENVFTLSQGGGGYRLTYGGNLVIVEL